MPLNNLLEKMAQNRASDLFISVGSPIQFKINGNMVAVNQTRLNPTQVEVLLRKVVSDKDWARFSDENELNIGYGLTGVGSFRLSLFKQRGSTAAVIRYIPGDIPAFDTLGLPPVLKEMIMQPRGLMLLVGATGTGKTTTLASLIDYRNANRTGHILTLEDPIEFVFRNQKSIVNQRQIGTDAKDLGTALKSALRQAPDCILIGEIRDVEAMTAAITYAQSGHLVLATLHANNASHALNRIISFYAPENRNSLLADLSTTLRGIVSQRLLQAKGGGRVPAVEVLINTTHVAELICSNRLTEVPNAITNSLAAGSQSFEQSLIQLIRADRISREDALQYSDSPTNLLWMLDNTEDEETAAINVSPESIGELSLPSMLQQQAAEFNVQRPSSRHAPVQRKTLADLDSEAPAEAPASAEPPATAGNVPDGAGLRSPGMPSIPTTASREVRSNPPSPLDMLEMAPFGNSGQTPFPTGSDIPPPLSATNPTADPQHSRPAGADQNPQGAQGAQGASFAEFLIKL
ncbi:MAG: PilT/PilU family type 4a pilus ATPase [Lautropia sp.]|nr:PilT/PilU family type 4a pilus ATPase [Lautropia sp.]